MALRDQPYLPLYIQDFLTDEKLMDCSAESTGVYIRLMCLMHKSEHYGKILLKQKYKQRKEQTKNFASQIARHFPYFLPVVENSLSELVSEKVLFIEGDFLIQKRMVKDNELSEIRSKAGRTGGKKTASKTKTFANNFAKAKTQTNTENEDEDEIENEIENETIKKEFQETKRNEKQKFVNSFKEFLESKNYEWIPENDFSETSSLYEFLRKRQFEKTGLNQKLIASEAMELIQSIYEKTSTFHKQNFSASYFMRYYGKIIKGIKNGNPENTNNNWNFDEEHIERIAKAGL